MSENKEFRKNMRLDALDSKTLETLRQLSGSKNDAEAIRYAIRLAGSQKGIDHKRRAQELNIDAQQQLLNLQREQLA